MGWDDDKASMIRELRNADATFKVMRDQNLSVEPNVLKYQRFLELPLL